MLYSSTKPSTSNTVTPLKNRRSSRISTPPVLKKSSLATPIPKNGTATSTESSRPSSGTTESKPSTPREEYLRDLIVASQASFCGISFDVSPSTKPTKPMRQVLQQILDILEVLDPQSSFIK